MGDRHPAPEAGAAEALARDDPLENTSCVEAVDRGEPSREDFEHGRLGLGAHGADGFGDESEQCGHRIRLPGYHKARRETLIYDRKIRPFSTVWRARGERRGASAWFDPADRAVAAAVDHIMPARASI